LAGADEAAVDAPTLGVSDFGLSASGFESVFFAGSPELLLPDDDDVEEEPLRLSLMYQPLPLKTTPTG
jgi:hypothetical protein